MTQSLPEVTQPWHGPIRRRHRPLPSKDYRAYRACLRWEFSFSCAFCLLHEADIMASGAEGWGVMAIEHFVPQSHAPELANVYSNCFYICALCNRARGDRPNRSPDGAHLLNPCDDPWDEIFRAEGDQVEPLQEGDGDAVYTCETYDFNDPRKVRARRMRRLLIRQCRDFLNHTKVTGEALLEHAVETGDIGAVKIAQGLTAMRRLATQELLRFQALPQDRPSTCLCENTSHHSLLRVLE